MEIELEQNIKTKPKGPYKYAEGSVQHAKDTGYNKTYYQGTRNSVKCDLCSIPVLMRCLKRHQLTKRCFNFRCEPLIPNDIVQ